MRQQILLIWQILVWEINPERHSMMVDDSVVTALHIEKIYIRLWR